MSDCHQVYKSLENLREQWADIMLDALKQQGHVHLDEAAYYSLKGDLMQLLIGRMLV